MGKPRRGAGPPNFCATYGFAIDCQGSEEAHVVESTELIKKLQIKAGARLWLINVPTEVAEAISAGAEIEVAKAGEPCDGVVAFAANPLEASEFAKQALQVL